jgi:hypothetical protein
MSDLVFIAFPSEQKAEEVREKVLEMQKEYLIELGDAVVAVKDDKGRIKLNQLMNTTAAGAVDALELGLQRVQPPLVVCELHLRVLLDPREMRTAVDDEFLGVHGGLTRISGASWCKRDGWPRCAALARIKALHRRRVSATKHFDSAGILLHVPAGAQSWRL